MGSALLSCLAAEVALAGHVNADDPGLFNGEVLPGMHQNRGIDLLHDHGAVQPGSGRKLLTAVDRRLDRAAVLEVNGTLSGRAPGAVGRQRGCESRLGTGPNAVALKRISSTISPWME